MSFKAGYFKLLESEYCTLFLPKHVSRRIHRLAFWLSIRSSLQFLDSLSEWPHHTVVSRHHRIFLKTGIHRRLGARRDPFGSSSSSR